MGGNKDSERLDKALALILRLDDENRRLQKKLDEVMELLDRYMQRWANE